MLLIGMKSLCRARNLKGCIFLLRLYIYISCVFDSKSACQLLMEEEDIW